jgi:hypothetical protein
MFKMHLLKKSKIIVLLSLISLMLNSCGLPGADARKYPPDPKKRVQKNMEDGKGFKFSTKKKNTGTFEFASSNELWRASLDTIDFMPLTSVNYSGGIIITDWYSASGKSDESIKVSIRFLTNEIRSDALYIKVFNKKCDTQNNCIVSEKNESLISELKAKILKTASVYKEESKKKKKK